LNKKPLTNLYHHGLTPSITIIVWYVSKAVIIIPLSW
jgi:hypothetical protein